MIEDSTSARLANARVALETGHDVAERASARPDADHRTIAGYSAAVEQGVAAVHREAADSGFAGAYPMPEIGAVDEWLDSGRQQRDSDDDDGMDL